MASETEQGKPAYAALDTFLNLLVLRPGRHPYDSQARKDLIWLVNFVAGKFENGSGEGQWPNLDMVACAAEEDADNFKDKKFPGRIIDNLRILPPPIGFVDESERVHLTALGLLLSKNAASKADTLAKLALECYRKKMADNNGREHSEQEYPLLADETSAPTGLADMLPGVSLTTDSSGGSLLVIDRAVLVYRELKVADGDLSEKLRLILLEKAMDRLSLDRRKTDRLKRERHRLVKWLRLLVSVLSGAQWPREETVDPGPRWLPGNEDDPAQLPSTGDTGDTGDTDEREYLATLLSVYGAQFGSYTTMLWQVPALSLTAQAFLMTIALNKDSSNAARVISALLSIVIAITSISLMHNHRGHAINYGELALRVSARLHLTRDFGRLAIHDAKPEFTDAEHVWVGWDRHIYHVWKICLGLFVVADVVIILLAFADALLGKSFGYL